MKKNIAVIFGGESTEHDISILTGLQVANALNKQKYNLIPIYIDSFGDWFCGEKLLNINFYRNFDAKKVKKVAFLPTSDFLFYEKFGKWKKHKKIDCAILALHGKNGEDGTIQGLLELAKIPYSSGGVFASSVGLDKQKMKELFIANNIPVCEYKTITKTNFQKNGIKKLGKITYPIIVKPNSLGSSIGISVCKDKIELKKALELAFCFDDVAIIEKCITDLREVNISVLGDSQNCVLSVTEQPNQNGLLTFEKKYMSNGKIQSKTDIKTDQKAEKTQNNIVFQDNNCGTKNGMQNLDRIVPAQISKTQQRQIEELAKKIFVVTKSKGVVRIDFLIDNKTQKVYANEINTIPGSFAFYLWQKTGIEFDELLNKIVDIAILDMQRQKELTKTFNSSVLSQNYAPKK